MDIIYRYDPRHAVAPDALGTAEGAMAALEEGNRRHRDIAARVRAELADPTPGEPIVVPSNPLSLGITREADIAPAQKPFAIILGCSDARASVERIFDHSLNQLFTIRVAGNVLGTECLGSIEYAVRNLSSELRLVAVLGHTGCGAVGAAVDLYLTPEVYIDVVKTHSLRSIVDRILVVVRGADRSLHEAHPEASRQPGYRQALLDMAVFLNAALTAHDLTRELDLAVDGPVRVVFAAYDILTHQVRAMPDADLAFRPAPRTMAEFAELSRDLARSVILRGVLGPTPDPNLA